MLVVQGITLDGRKFRPSKWADMLVGRYVASNIRRAKDSLSQKEIQQCISISRYVSICCNPQGFCEIRISSDLRNSDPTVYETIKCFAITNNLQYLED